MKIKALQMAVAMGATALLLGGINASATMLTISASSGTTSVTKTDADDGTVDGIASYSGNVGAWKVSVDYATSYPETGKYTFPIMDITYNVSSLNATKPLVLTATDSFDYDGTLAALLNGNFIAGAGSAQFVIKVDGNTVYTSSELTASGYAASTQFHVDGIVSIEEILTFTRTGSGTVRTTGDGGITPVPDGGLTISLLGFALVGAEGLRRRLSK